jgi:hypothetical protein
VPGLKLCAHHWNDQICGHDDPDAPQRKPTPPPWQQPKDKDNDGEAAKGDKPQDQDNPIIAASPKAFGLGRQGQAHCRN